MVFGKRVGGGRRTAPRLPTVLAASIRALDCSGVAALIDVSSTGAKLQGCQLPKEGEDVWIIAGPVDVLATVVWNSGDQCGVTFDAPVGVLQLKMLRGADTRARVVKVAVEQTLAAEDWENGLAR